MLNQGTVSATLAVSDIDKAKEFYGGTLGLEPVDENPGGVMYKSGDGTIFVYTSPTAGTNQATSARHGTLTTSRAPLQTLVAKEFEHYDMPNATLEGDIHIMGPMKAAWFKDPDGNILNISEM